MMSRFSHYCEALFSADEGEDIKRLHAQIRRDEALEPWQRVALGAYIEARSSVHFKAQRQNAPEREVKRSPRRDVN